MFCSKCGSKLVENAKFCPNCGMATINTNASVDQISEKAKKASLDAFNTFKIFSTNPVGNLGLAYSNLTSNQIIIVSVIFIVISVLMTTIGIDSIITNVLGYFSPKTFDLFLSSLLIPLAFFVVISLVSSIKNQKFSYIGELFIASVFNLPLGFFFLLTSIFSLKNMEIILALLFFLITYSILLLFSGCVKILNFSEKVSTILVPIIQLISFWLVSVLFRAIIL